MAKFQKLASASTAKTGLVYAPVSLRYQTASLPCSWDDSLSYVRPGALFLKGQKIPFGHVTDPRSPSGIVDGNASTELYTWLIGGA